jgi:hypothetical protein
VGRVRTLVALVVAALLLGTVALVLAADDEELPSACREEIRRAVLPAWARAGFSEARPRLPHALGSDGDIAALVFGHPLTSPPPEMRANKILWVSRVPLEPPSDLRISAQRMRGRERLGPVVRRLVEGGPGPSTINLPAPGCWRLSLRWSGHRDELDLVYEPRG